MGILSRIGCPEADADGTFHVSCKAAGDEVHLICRGHAFAVCKVIDGKPTIQIVDVDTGVKYTGSIQALCFAH